MNQVEKYTFWLLYLAVFTLPMYMVVNNILLGAFIFISLLTAMMQWSKRKFPTDVYKAWPVWVFFLLAIMASFHTINGEAFSYLEKYWSLLLLPLVFFLNQEGVMLRRREIFLSLMWGCTATLALCYGNMAWEMVAGAEPLSYIFRWRHIGQQFTDFADTHPTYLGLFIVTSILFLLQDPGFSKRVKFLLFMFLLVGLFQLASRMALLLFGLFLIYYSAKRFMENRWQVLVLLVGMALFSGIFMFYGSRYMEKRLFSSENVLEDKRIERWRISYEIFKEHPWLGVGYADVKQLRKAKYIENNFTVASEAEYNAHNQFLEYLNSNGFLGGVLYMGSLIYLLMASIKRRDTLFTFLFFAFMIANVTESMMVRIKGIEYFAIFATLFLCGAGLKEQESNEHIHNPGLRTIFRSREWNS